MKPRDWVVQQGNVILADAALATSTAEVASSENNFTMSLDDWEVRVFNSATTFRLSRFNASGELRAEVKTFPEALRLAGGVLGSEDRVLIYAVTESGRFFCIEQKKWSSFLDLCSTK